LDTAARIFYFIILIPHRDALKPFTAFRQKLFSEGIEGAYSFPLAAPLAQISIPFSGTELKELAGKIRESTKVKSGKISGGETTVVQGPAQFVFFGPVLDLPDINNDSFSGKEKILRFFNPPVLCTALSEKNMQNARETSLHDVPALSFRAGALANLAIRPFRLCTEKKDSSQPTDGVHPLASGERNYSYEWRQGPLVWLPACKRT